MEEHVPYLVELFNRWLGEPIARGLALIGVHVENTHEVVPTHVVMGLVVFAISLLLFGMARRSISIVPGKGQAMLELVLEALTGLLDDMVGPKGRRFLPIVATLTFFILFSNLLGLVPGFISPTANINTTAACAILVFLYYHGVGLREVGPVKYAKHFVGPVPWLAPLMVPIEIISHLARPVSLSIRLFGNVFGEEMIILILFSLVPIFVPLPMMGMAVFTSCVQTLVFVMLTMIYIAGAVQEEEH